MLNRIHPFEILKLIRDRRLTNVSDFESFRSAEFYPLKQVFRSLQALGWIKITPDGNIEPTHQISEVQMALELSLSRLEPYCADSVVANPLFGRPAEPPIPADVFVLMPFLDELKAVYEDHIQAVAKKLSVTALRADDFFAANSVISDVWNAINRAKILIADCTGRNPNVFYELGIAHTLGKPVILVAQRKDDIPFDVQHIRTILYSPTPRGMREFEAALERTLDRELTIPRTMSDILARKRPSGG